MKLGLSDIIAGFIDDMLKEADGEAELKRAELAGRFGVVPSQINYVIATRFSPERGYVVESRRGGGGYIRIRRVEHSGELLLMHTVNAVGESLDYRTAAALISNLSESDVITAKGAALMLAAVGNPALRDVPSESRDRVRGAILKQMLINLV